MSQQLFEAPGCGWNLRLRSAVWGAILGGMGRKDSPFGLACFVDRSMGAGINPAFTRLARPWHVRFMPVKSVWLVVLLMAMTAAPAAQGAASTSRTARVAFLGTDDQIYWCSGDCAKPECVTCPKQGFSVRRNPRVLPGVPTAGLRPVTMVQAPGMPPLPQEPERPLPVGMKYGWPTFSPDGSEIAFAWAGPAADGNFFGLTVYEFARHKIGRAHV